MFPQVLTVLVALCATSWGHGPSRHHQENNSPVAKAPVGTYIGTIMESRLGKSIYSFKGIKYAKAPVGELRFKPPIPVDKFEGVYNATEDPPFCPQTSFGKPMSEDCLFLSVYSTELPGQREKDNVTRPVIIFFHPGGFYVMGAAWFQPQYIMDKDIVLVTVNYRLATLGFLATGTEEAPGNNGLKDQVVALRWVKDNIAAFGGDPNSVTLMGCSAGSLSVILHMISPMSRGLFHRGISLSGSPTMQAPFGEEQIDLAKLQAQFLGCPDDNVTEIIKCLKTKPADEFGSSLERFFGRVFFTDPILVWTPVVEKDFGQERFLTEDPAITIQKGNFSNVPLIAGVTKNEFALRGLYVIDNDTLLKQINDDWDEVAPIAFQYERNTERSREASKGLRKFYFNDEPITNSSATKLGELYADAIIGFGVNRVVKLMAQKNTEPTYHYRFSYQGRYSYFYVPDTNETYGVAHHDDLIYLFYMPEKPFPLFQKDSPKEIEMVETLTTLYANFAKSGKPTLPDQVWEPYELDTQKYLDINVPMTMKTKLYEDRYNEWDRLFPLENN